MERDASYLQNPETDFPNDSMTDWVLNGEERPVVKNGEIVNEPEDVAENAITPAKDEDKDCWFPIHFNYNGIDHTADVLKKNQEVTEFHVTGVTPSIERLPDPFVIASTLSKEAFDFPVNEIYYPRTFGLTLIKAIGTGCDHSDIALS